jgi:AcrR family transcriptional regulator
MSSARRGSREATLAAAADVLAREGADALTVRRIAAEAGSSTIAVYHYFGGKDGVVDTLYRDGFERLASAMSAVPVTDDPVGDLRLICRAYRERALASPASYAVMFTRPVRGYTPSEQSVKIARGVYVRLVTAVARCVDRGAFDGDPREIAHLLYGVLHGMLMLELTGNAPNRRRSEERAYAGVDRLLASFAPRQGRARSR